MMKRMMELLQDLGNISIHRHQPLLRLNRYPNGCNSLAQLLKGFTSNLGNMKSYLVPVLIQLERSRLRQEPNQLNRIPFKHHS
jgi:hypothetical protein